MTSANDTSQEGKDVGGAFIGQDSQLLWTQEGVESWLGEKYSHMHPHGEEPVPELLLALEPNIRKHALEQKWFKETKMEPAPLMQLQNDNCGNVDKCHKDFREQHVRTCAQGSSRPARP